MPTIISPLTIIALLVVCNLVSFALVGIDKRKSINGHERVPEVYFFVWAIFLSSLGVLAGMFTFHHKTRKWQFIWGISILALQQIALVYLILEYFK